MTDNEKHWLLTTFNWEYFRANAAMNGDTLSAYYEAERILNGKKEINKRDCNCSLGGLRKSVTEKYLRFLNEQKQAD